MPESNACWPDLIRFGFGICKIASREHWLGGNPDDFGSIESCDRRASGGLKALLST